MNADDRRENKRTHVRTLAFVGTEDQRYVLLELLNVSASGMRVRTDNLELKNGEVIELEIEIDGESIEATGEVRNVNAERKEAGIMFVDISEDAVVTLETLASSENW